jgi:hypothetical protein
VRYDSYPGIGIKGDNANDLLGDGVNQRNVSRELFTDKSSPVLLPKRS